MRWVITWSESHHHCGEFLSFETAITDLSPLEFIKQMREKRGGGTSYAESVALINAWREDDLK